MSPSSYTVLFQAFSSLANAGVSYWNAAEGRRLQKELHFDSQQFQKELHAEAFERQRQLLQLGHEFQAHQSTLAHERQKELVEFQRMLQAWPLLPTPQQVSLLDGDFNLPALTVLLAPMAIAPGVDRDSAAAANSSHHGAQRDLRDFLSATYSDRAGAIRPARFIGGAWRADGAREEAGTLTLFYFLRGLPTLVLEPCYLQNSHVEVRFAYWGLMNSRPVQGVMNEVSLGQLSASYRFLCAALADCHFLLHSEGATTPAFPEVCRAWASSGESNFQAQWSDELISTAVAGYQYVLSALGTLRSDPGVGATFDLAEHLAATGYGASAKELYYAAIFLYMKGRGLTTQSVDPVAAFLAAGPPFSLVNRLVRGLKAVHQASAPEVNVEFVSGDLANHDEIASAQIELRNLVGMLERLKQKVQFLTREGGLISLIGAAEALLSESDIKLRKPALRIATMAVTSAGKSTLVNALIGKELAPVSKKEMSAGTLRIRHSKQCLLTVEDTKGSTWRAGRFTHGDDKQPLGDKKVYEILKGIMRQYHDARANGNPAIPRFLVETPILPNADRALFDLPSAVDVEIVDLPGLNETSGDNDSVRYIVDQARDCFALFVLDYMDTTKRSEVLLRSMAPVFANKRDSEDLLFVLNKYLERDRSDADWSLEDEIAEKQGVIQTALELTVPPLVVPVEARLWCWAQLAWGACSLAGDATAPNGDRRALLMEIQDFYGGKIGRFVRGDAGLSRWWRENPDLSELDTSALRFFIERIAFPLSGAQMLYKVVRERLKSRLGALLLRPIFRSSLVAAEKAIAQVATTASLRSKQTAEAAATVGRDLTEKIRAVELSIRNSCKQVDMAVDALGKIFEVAGNDASALRATAEFIKVTKGLSTVNGRAAVRFWETVRDLENRSRNDLMSCILDPISGQPSSRLEAIFLGFKKKGALSGENEIADRLQAGGLSPVRSTALGEAFTTYQQQISTFATYGNTATLKFPANDAIKRERGQAALDKLRLLRLALRDAITERISFQVAIQATAIEESLKDILRSLQTEGQAAASGQGIDTVLFDAILQTWYSEVFADGIRIPDALFDMEFDTAEARTSVYQQVGWENKPYRPWWLLFLVEVEKEVPKFGNVDYHTFTVPTPIGIRNACLDAHKKEMELIGRIFSEWARGALGAWHAKISKAANELTDLTSREVDAMSKLSQQELASREREWTEVGELAKKADISAKALEGRC